MKNIIETKLLKSTNIYEPVIKVGLENNDWIKVN